MVEPVRDAPVYGPAREFVVWRIVLEALFPRFCLGCRSRLPAIGATLDLCRRCEGRLVSLAPGRCCRTCGRSLPGGRAPEPLCVRCLGDPPPWRRLHALWLYREPLDAVIAGLKFRGLDYLGEGLASRALGSRGGDLGGLDAVVPVPLGWSRRLGRGYNQAGRIGRPLARGLGIDFVPALSRTGWTRPRQVGLGRRQRLRLAGDGTMRARFGTRVAGRRVLLIDDVLTTGATARAATSALKAAGALAVEILVAGLTPHERARRGPS